VRTEKNNNAKILAIVKLLSKMLCCYLGGPNYQCFLTTVCPENIIASRETY
jgi:hypothetical protein